jgi:hypothetical protein
MIQNIRIISKLAEDLDATAHSVQEAHMHKMTLDITDPAAIGLKITLTQS